MSTSQALLGSTLRDHVAPALRAHGFSGSGQDFHRRIEGNWAAINIQRDRYSTAAELRFTVNLGTASTAVRHEDGFPTDEPAREIDCHWRTRIGSLLPSGEDTWWKVRVDMRPGELEVLGGTIAGNLVQYGIPRLEAMAPDEAILSIHLQGEPGPDMEFAAMDVVGPILRRLGPSDRFERFLAVLDADPASLDRHLLLDDLIQPRMGPARVAKALERLDAKGFEPRQRALLDLGFAEPTPTILESIRPAIGDPDWRIRFAAANALGRLGDISSLGSLEKLVAGDPVRYAAIHAAVALLRLAPRLDSNERRGARAAIARRRDRAVGHDRSAMSEILRRLPAG